MIEFKGYISGAAEKLLKKKVLTANLLFVAITTILILPMTLFFEQILPLKGLATIVNIMVPIFFCIPAFLTVSKKYINELKPKRVLINTEYVIVECGKESECKLLSDVKKVVDHGDFYEIYFYGKKKFHYFCQKDKIFNGTIDEFETLFKGFIITKTNHEN